MGTILSKIRPKVLKRYEQYNNLSKQGTKSLRDCNRFINGINSTTSRNKNTQFGTPTFSGRTF